jgi:hypothetical protein
MRMWGIRNTCSLLVGIQASVATLENNRRLLNKPDLVLPYDAAIALLGIYQRNETQLTP